VVAATWRRVGSLRLASAPCPNWCTHPCRRRSRGPSGVRQPWDRRPPPSTGWRRFCAIPEMSPNPNTTFSSFGNILRHHRLSNDSGIFSDGKDKTVWRRIERQPGPLLQQLDRAVGDRAFAGLAILRRVQHPFVSALLHSDCLSGDRLPQQR